MDAEYYEICGAKINVKESLQDRVPWPDHHGYRHHGTRFNVKEKLLMSFLGLLRRRRGED